MPSLRRRTPRNPEPRSHQQDSLKIAYWEQYLRRLLLELSCYRSVVTGWGRAHLCCWAHVCGRSNCGRTKRGLSSCRNSWTAAIYAQIDKQSVLCCTIKKKNRRRRDLLHLRPNEVVQGLERVVAFDFLPLSMIFLSPASLIWRCSSLRGDSARQFVSSWERVNVLCCFRGSRYLLPACSIIILFVLS